MNRQRLFEDILSSSVCTFSRSQGPGGQNVNKVNSKVRLSVMFTNLRTLDEHQRELLKETFPNGRITLQVQQTRSQKQNRTIAACQAADRIMDALIEPSVRKKTKASRAAHEKRLERKHRASRRKALRRSVDLSDHQ